MYDAVHEAVTQNEVDLLSPGGTLVTVSPVPLTLDLSGDRKVVAVFGSTQIYKEEGRKLFGALSDFLEKGIIKVCGIL